MGFTLLVTEGDTGGADAFVAAAAEAKVPLEVLAPPDRRLRARYGARFVLIRPDQHVGWRGDAPPGSVAGLFACLTGSKPQAP